MSVFPSYLRNIILELICLNQGRWAILICSILYEIPSVLFALMVAVLLISNFLKMQQMASQSLCFCKCRLGNRWRASDLIGEYKVRLYFKSPCSYQTSCFSVWGAREERASFCCLLLRPRCFLLAVSQHTETVRYSLAFIFPVFVSCC